MTTVILILLSIIFLIPINSISQIRLIAISPFSHEASQDESQFCQFQVKAQFTNPLDVNDFKIDMLFSMPPGNRILSHVCYNKQNVVPY